MPSSRTKKILSFALISAVGLTIGIIVSFWIALRLSVPATDGEISLSGLKHPVEITFDSMGICQIWAQTETDACFALGYQHAADRMFQMDLSRRLAGGRLSEMLGSITRMVDFDQRRIGHHRFALRASENLSENNRLRLQAYADGINAYKNNCRALPFEYRFLSFEFEDWTVLDCLTLLSFQTWFSNALMNRDEFHLELAKEVAPEKAKSLVFPYPDWAPTTVPEPDKIGSLPNTVDKVIQVPPEAILSSVSTPLESYSFYRPFQRAIAENLFSMLGMPLLMTHSSNAWVVGPQKSASGKPILSSDPHLELTRLPQFWYPAGVHIEQDSLDVLGISTPGLPFFIMGHNGQAAWAFTAGGIDVTDYNIVKLHPDDITQYQTPEGWRGFDVIHDSLYVSDIDSFVQVRIRQTADGPVIGGNAGTRIEAYTMHWVGFDIDLDEAVSNGFNLHRVRTYEQFQNVVTKLGALDANMLYADADGNIGYQLTTPLRDGRNYIPADLTPQSKNPRQGWLASCNNMPMRSPYVSGHFFTNRILSITHLLDSIDVLSADDMRGIQMDRKDRYLARHKDETARLLDIIDEPNLAVTMRDWDGSSEPESKEAALMNIFLAQLKQMTFEDELGALYSQVPAKWIDYLDQVGQAGWFDDSGTPDVEETYDDIAINAMEETVGMLNGSTWGDIHTLSMHHPLSMIPVVSGLLNLSSGPVPWGGSAGTLCASFSREAGEGLFESVAGPSWRFVIDFANVDSATMVLPAGVSGNPMSDHFFDFNQMWKEGRQWVVPIHYDKVKEKAISTLILTPAQDE